MKTGLILAAALGALVAGAAGAQEMTAEAVFEFVDADGNDSLSFAEISGANSNVTQEIFAEYDADSDGGLSLDEFRNLFANGPRPPGL
jgi:Ca2+-binding EF-hand superfamily protein